MQTTNILNLLREKEIKLQREITKAITSIAVAKSLSRILIKFHYDDAYKGLRQYLRLIKASNSGSNFATKEEAYEKKKTNEKTNSQKFTCPNPKCERTFSSPITVQNLTEPNRAPYYACPYCLTEMGETSENQLKAHRTGRSETERLKTQPVEAEPPQEPPSHKCPYHFGYLSKRSKEEKIPDECMICEKLIDCMANSDKRSEYDLVLAT
jgi:hypothetical protein